MGNIILGAAAGLVLGLAAPAASAHAFLDHADPAVGSTVPTAPAAVTLWFTQNLEPAFCHVTVSTASGARVDRGNVASVPGHPDELQVGLKALPPGTYSVSWHVVSVDTHPTEGTFTFEVAK